MEIAWTVFKIAGGLCTLLFGMKAMSDGLQQAAGERLQKVLDFMTGNRFIGVLSGVVVTFMIHSSAAVSIMVVSFVNAGLLTLSQAIGVIMGANIGTTLTAWMVSLLGFSVNISAFAYPAVAAGFVMRTIKWKHKTLGEVILGFGFLFLGLDIMTGALPVIHADSIAFIADLSHRGYLSVLIGIGVGAVVTVMMNSSTATTVLVITLAYRDILNFQMAASIILGANIGTTLSAPIAAINARTAAKRTALVHVLFNVIGAAVVAVFFEPFVRFVDYLCPGPPEGSGITLHISMFHTVFNTTATLILLPFVNQFAALVTFIIPEKKEKAARLPDHYKLEQSLLIRQNTPEFNIIHAEKEISDMAGMVAAMYADASEALEGVTAEEGEERKFDIDSTIETMKAKESYVDEMREELSRFLIECTAQQLSAASEYNISQLLRIIGDLEDMADDCFGIIMILERSVRKNQIFRRRETEALAPYVAQVEEFLSFVRENLGRPGQASRAISKEQIEHAEELELNIDKSRNRLRKLSRKRIESGADVKTELLFIDLVRRIERLGDFCYNISEALFHMR